MEILRIDSLDGLDGYQDTWTDMLTRINESSSVFLSPTWVFNWWDCFGRGKDLCILLSFEKDRMMGMAPLAIFTHRILGIPVRILRFIGYGHADHMDFCIDESRRRDIMESFFNYMFEELSWDVMDLMDVPEDSPNLPILKELFDKYHITVDIQKSIVCPYLPLNGDRWEAYYAGKRSKSTRQDLRRRMRRLGDLGVVAFRRYEDSESAGHIFPQLLHVYEKRWKNKNLSVSFVGEKDRVFYRKVTVDFALDGRLHLLTLELDQQVIAFTLSAIMGTRFTWLITAFDPAFTKFFAGELVLTHLLEDVFQRAAFNEFDFTRGDEPYKFKWTDRQRWNLRILAQNKGFMKKVPFSAIRSYAAIRREAKKSEFLRKVKLNFVGQISRAVGR
jgi:CelD/BcsL family acetyltransferase involved in cellulose biosynthesis